jgi:two-component system, LytTR family, sensor kinase
MLSTSTIRRYELLIVLSATTAYIVRRLFETAARFNHDIRLAQREGVRTSTILTDLAAFDYNQHVIFPTIAGGAALFLGAWYVFHYYTFPRLREKNFDTNTLLLGALTVALVTGSMFVYSYFKLEWRFRHDAEDIVGFRVYSLFRKLYLLTNTLGVLLILLCYEAFAQVFYRTAELYEQQRQPRHQMLLYAMLILAGAALLLWVTTGQVANLILNGRSVTASLVIITLTVVLHQFFFTKIIPYFSRFQLDTLDGFLYLFAGVCAYGLVSLLIFFIWIRVTHEHGSVYVAFYLLPSGLGLVTAIIRWVFFVENQQLQTQVLQTTAELSTLRSQVNPHFLFNALNTLYSVAMKEKSETTADGIQKLGDMMRFMLHENNQDRIPLSKEIEYLHNFLDLQRMRLDASQDIEIRVNIQEPEREVYLAPMLLNPFVENAFKHGISFRKPSWVYITLTQDATKLYFKVHNSAHSKSAGDPEKDASGIGLENVRKRLELLYPTRHTLDIQATDRDFFVSLILGIY